MAPHSSTFAWKIPQTKEPGGLQSMGSLESDTTEQLHFHFSLSCIEEGNGNPLQCSCLESPRDGEAWWAAVYGVAQSRTRLKQLSSSSSRSSREMNQQDLCIFLSVYPSSYQFAFSYCSWCSQGKNTEVVCHSLLQGIFLAQESNTHLLRWQVDSLPLLLLLLLCCFSRV